PCNNAARLQLPVNAPAYRILDRLRAAHRAAGPVTGRTEGLFHAAGLTDQHPAGPAHVAWNDHGLTDYLVNRWYFWMIWRKCTGRSLAMDPDALSLAANRVFLELGNVVADIVNQIHLQFLPAPAKMCGKDFAGLLHQQL